MVETQEIARSDGFCITGYFRAKKPRRLIITFGDIKSRLASEGFGTRWALATGYDTIYVAQKRKTQYQLLSRETFKASVKDYLGGYETICTYGASVGGYAAFYFGGAIRRKGNRGLATFVQSPAFHILTLSRRAFLP
ncbi:hypothetical protein [Pontibaca salina]|uniref:Alpha/beta hydrolase n=1 Tax=Pontibaca salina TaxID=2795731 RepID=A0A934M339_9RHOB|nr:hypothetical protein [Pontibaca salina]MBI6629459.1 hypothetical protein [Pontibaca salina]